ncbi:MAG TPA: dihydrofolate reductase [Lachnospiraceae bacterium]|jgi:dihydrofolate reductase|nr:dihydrofolate reductase [Acutalibacteraceae bacterium]CDC38739.1 dihydrofolate reductase [Butyrivibrio sp. CAG:318]HJI31974.1 dihydrofolate reductase [Lachnospiraceae bacterium]
MNLIAAVDRNWAIGYKNELLVRIPEDQKWFRETTTGKAVIMGRKTLESFPNKSPLKNRLNVVITSDMNYSVPGAVVVHSIDEAVEAVRDYADDDVYVIGGESIYRQMLPLCSTAHITKVDYAYQADAHFPDLDKEEGWKITETSDERTYFDIIYEFVKYERV